MRKMLLILFGFLLVFLAVFFTERKSDEKIKTEKHTGIEKQTKTEKIAEISTAERKEKKIKIAIDPGHQKDQMLKQEPIGPGASETKAKVSSGTEGCITGRPEYQVNLEISMKLKEVLADRGYEVYMIRESNNVSLSNRKRAEMANKSGSKLFLRIHCNSDENSWVQGALTMCPTDSNTYCSEIINDSQKLAQVVEKSLCQKTGAKNRGIIQTDQMSGINWSKIPVTIIETGFMSNPEEDKKLSDEVYQNQLAEGIADGVDIYMKNK